MNLPTVPQSPTKSLFKLNVRYVGDTCFLSVISQRGALVAQGAEKVLPPICVYDNKGLVNVEYAEDVLAGWHPHPYKPNSPDFNPERLADTDIASLQKYLEHYPILNEELIDGRRSPHPVAEFIYSQMMYLKPTTEFAKQLSALNFLERGKLQAQALEVMNEHLKEVFNINLDLYSVPKRYVGTRAYIATPAGYAYGPSILSFGLHRAIPTDRIGRELSSIKSCERFETPATCNNEAKVPDWLSPYVTWLRVGIIFPETSLMDSADLYPSATDKLACKIQKLTEVRDFTDIPVADRKLVGKNYRAGIELVHEDLQVLDETVEGIACVKLVTVSGVKVVAQKVSDTMQAVCVDGKPVDCIMDFATFAGKGALAVIAAMIDPSIWTKRPEHEECKEIVESYITNPGLQDAVCVGDAVYKGFVGYLPFFRTRHRHTELNKGTNNVGADIVTNSILKQPFSVRKDVEEEYTDIKDFRNTILDLRDKINDQQPQYT